jgi:lactobin A/cerein 7B family class IIb bacteriocin
MFTTSYELKELSLEEAAYIQGGFANPILEAAILVVGAAYGAGYALGEFAYNLTH